MEDVHKIVCRHLENWGARCLTPDERISGQDHDVLVTDDPSKLSGWALLLAEDELGHHALNDQQYRVNFNLSNALLDALLALIAMTRAGSLLFWHVTPPHQAAPPPVLRGFTADVAPVMLLLACILVLTAGASTAASYTAATAEQLLQPGQYISSVLRQGAAAVAGDAR